VALSVAPEAPILREGERPRFAAPDRAGLGLTGIVKMPANNFSLVFRGREG
jgi:hypothetical protein